MKNTMIEGRALHFTQAYSAAQAQEILQKSAPFAVAMIDVVMESDNAGLQLVRFIHVKRLKTAPFVLFCAQASQATPLKWRPFTITISTTTAPKPTLLRLGFLPANHGHSCLCPNTTNRGQSSGLGANFAASRELSRPVRLHKFANGLVLQLCALLQIDAEALVCAVIQNPMKTLIFWRRQAIMKIDWAGVG